jgi:hypothetical protein
MLLVVEQPLALLKAANDTATHKRRLVAMEGTPLPTSVAP